MPIQDLSSISLGLGVIEFGNYVSGTFGTYRDVGAVKADCSIKISREVLDFETGRPLVVILQEVIRERVEFSATLAEVTLATIKQALGQGDITSSVVPVFLDGTSSALTGTLQSGKTQVLMGSVLKFGGIPTHAYIGLRFTHEKADGDRHIFEGYKASPMGDLVLPFKETDWNTYDISFRMLADTTKAAGDQYFQFFIEGQEDNQGV